MGVKTLHQDIGMDPAPYGYHSEVRNPGELEASPVAAPTPSSAPGRLIAISVIKISVTLGMCQCGR